MTAMQLDSVNDLLWDAAGLIALTFAVLYHFRSGGGWRRWPESRHLMRFSIAFGVVALLTGTSKYIVTAGVSIMALVICETVLAGILVAETSRRLYLMIRETASSPAPSTEPDSEPDQLT